MVILVEKLFSRAQKFPSRLENTGHDSEAVSAYLRDFRSKISNFITQILLKPGLEHKFLSVAGITKSFELINVANKAFAKLVVDIDHPTSKWGGDATEEYLKYTLNLLDMLNSVSSTVSHVNQAKVSLFYALSLVDNSPSSAIQHLKKIPPCDLVKKDIKVEGLAGIEQKAHSGKEYAVVQALLIMESTIFWALGLILSGLCSDVKPYLEMRKMAARFDDSLITGLESRACVEINEKQGVLEEVKDVNDVASCLSGVIFTAKCGLAAKELKTRLEVLGSSLEDVRKNADSLFSEVLATRNKVLENFRHVKNRP